jgi:small-conductance mechanosensitive channel
MLDSLPIPPWIVPALWSSVCLLTAWLVGHVGSRIIGSRLAAWAGRTSWHWDNLVIDALQRGLPLWSLLGGLYLALGFWNLPPHFHGIVSRVTYVLLWLSVTLIVAGVGAKLIVLYGQRFQQTLPVTSVTENIVRLVILGLGGLMILNGLGISIAPILTALGVGGLAIALALQDTLANLFAGFYLTVSRELRLGDYVKLESGQEGYVEDIGWRSTRIRMLANNRILVPNKKLGEAILTNFDMPSQDLAVLIEVGVDYGSDLQRVERVTVDVGREVMQQVSGGVPGFEPFIRYHTFGDFSINFTVILRAKTFVDQYLVKHEFVKRLHERYGREGIVIPFPTRTVYTKAEALD